MADRHRRIGPFAALHQEQRHRLADDVASPDDDGMSARDWDVIAQQQLLNAIGSAWQESRMPLHDQPDILRMKRIDILQRADRAQHAAGVDLPRQRRLHEDAVNRRTAWLGGVSTARRVPASLSRSINDSNSSVVVAAGKR